MKAPRSALLLVGSPKPGSSASLSLGQYLLDRLADAGLSTEAMTARKAVKSPAAARELCAAVDAADLLILSSPLYVDSLPAPVVEAFETIAEHRRHAVDTGSSAGDASPAFAALVQSGFPEARHNDVALAISRNFARAAGLDWLGGLAVGAGGMIDGRPLAETGGVMRHRRRALDLAAEALAAGRPIPDEAVTLMARLPIPAAAYRFMGELGWRKLAKGNGVRRDLVARPFEGTRAIAD
jgi:hypothetical protein